MDFRRCLEVQLPYLGPVIGVYTDWTPLANRPGLFPEDIDESDPWQFRNVLVQSFQRLWQLTRWRRTGLGAAELSAPRRERAAPTAVRDAPMRTRKTLWRAGARGPRKAVAVERRELRAEVDPRAAERHQFRRSATVGIV